MLPVHSVKAISLDFIFCFIQGHNFLLIPISILYLPSPRVNSNPYKIFIIALTLSANYLSEQDQPNLSTITKKRIG